jgi:hypothetical protein
MRSDKELLCIDLLLVTSPLRYFLRTASRLRRGRDLRALRGSEAVGAMTFAFSLC